MAEISIEIDDNDLDRVQDAISANYNKPASENKEDFVDQVIINFLQENVLAYEKRSAKKTVNEEVDNKPKAKIKKNKKNKGGKK